MKLSTVRISVLTAIFFVFCSHANAANPNVPVSSSDVFTVQDKKGKNISCILHNSKYQCGKMVGSDSFHLASTDVAKIAKKIKTLKKKKQTSKIPALKKKLSKLKKQVKQNDALCTTGAPATGPSSDAVSLEKLDRVLTSEDVRYLAEKAGFGFSAREEWLVDVANSGGIDGLVDNFMSLRAEDSGLLSRVDDLTDQNIGSTTTQSPSGQREALFELWTHTNNPYSERMALFLLSVWTVSGDVIGDETFRFVFWDYYARLRNFASDTTDLPSLALQITRDPLMLKYLNNELNVKKSPNENYARELMELFTLGTQDLDGNPNYTETALDGTGDIATAARMLSGWKTQLDYTNTQIKVTYDNFDHALGPHTMFTGKSYQFVGNTDEDLVKGIFANHPNVKIYYAKEILKEYLTPDPPRELIENFAKIIKDNNYQLRPAMAVLLKSKAFYHANYKDTLPKNSIEFGVEAVKILGLENNYDYAGAEYKMRSLGMQVNQAPSVFWFNANAWTSSAIAIERSNLVAQIIGDTTALNQTSPAWTAASVLPSSSSNVSETITYVANRLGISDLSANETALIGTYMNQTLEYDNSYASQPYSNASATIQKQKGIGLYYILMTTPSFQLK